MNKNTTIAIAVVVALVLGGALWYKQSQKTADTASAPTAEQTPAANSEAQTAAAPKLEITDSVVGSGTEAVSGKTITVHYTGTLTNGTKFDSSLDRKEPFTFSLGAGQVIKGWDQGFAGMKVGGKRKLVIPPELAYGPNAVGSIPANSTLVFEVELLEVK